MLKSKYMKIAVPATVIAAVVAIPLSLNTYASSPKQMLTIYSAKLDKLQPEQTFSPSAEAIFFPDVNYLVWLKDQKSYNIVGEERFIGQNATTITGKLGEPLAKKSQLTDFKMWADLETGEILNIAIFNGAGVPRSLKPEVPHPPKPQPETEREVKERLTQDINGADNEFDKQIRPISVYTAKLTGKMQVDVVAGHFIKYVDTSWVDDPQDGVISVHIHLQGSMVTDSSYKVYHTSTKHGELKIVSVKDKNLFSLVAADGTKFTFDLKSRTVTQVQ
jgi:hypothetical protein